MALGKGIPVINGFDLNSKLPLDSRAVADTMENMNKLVTDGSVGDGQLCYCKADKKLYVLKDNVWTEVGGGGGKSVPPTLNLYNFETSEVRTSITQEEKDNLEKGLYNQVFYPEGGFEGCFMPSKIFCNKSLGLNIFVQFYVDRNAGSITSLTLYNLSIGEKDTSGNYPITIENQDGVPVGSGGASIPTLETKRSYIDANDTIYSDADIELIKKQENNFINLPVEGGNNVVNTLCFVVKNQMDSSGNSYILTAVGGWAVTITSLLSYAPVLIVWNANITTKKLTMQQATGLSYDNTALYVQDNKIFLTDTLTTQDPVNILHNSYTFDTINGNPIIHSGATVNSYNIPTDLIASANKLSLGVGNAPLGNGVNLDGFTYDNTTKTLKVSGADTDVPSFELEVATEQERAMFGFVDLYKHSLTEAELTLIKNRITNNHPILGKAIIDSTQYVSLLQPYVQDLTENYIGGDCGTGMQLGLVPTIITLKWMIIGNTLYVGSFYQVTLNYGLKISGDKLSMGVGNAMIDSPSVYFSSINGQCVCATDLSNTKNYSFTEDKVISLFGKHRILVPKDSADTNILPLPADASTSTYVLKAVNGTVQWVKEA